MPLRLDVKRKLLARSDRVKSVDLHPTEPWMLASLYNGHVHIWNYENQQLVKSFEVCDLPVRCSKFVPRKQWILVGSDDMQCRVYNYNTLERIGQWEAHSDYLRSVTVHPTQSYFLTSSDDMSIKLWDWEQKFQCKQVFEGHSHYVMQIVINPKDNNTFASASLDRTIKVWQFGSTQPNFTLEGHEKGVNCVDYYHGGDKPYLISGADDRLVKIWDYQNKVCVMTLEGHAQNIAAVCWHPELPLLLTGSEDSTVRIWHSATYRLETTLNYGLERVWTISALRGSNALAIGYDEGAIVLKLGREEPAVSMDTSGKLVWAKHCELQQANAKQVLQTGTMPEDGERLQLGVKDMGACEIYPQTLQHSPNGRFVTACGDGEYIIYTAMALRNKAYGTAQEFIWSADSNMYAVRETSNCIKLFKNFKEVRNHRVENQVEQIFGGHLMGVRTSNSLSFYDWETMRLIRRIEILPRQVIWSEAGQLVAIIAEDSFYMLKYFSEKAGENSESVDHEDGIEEAFEVAGEMQEGVKTGIWVGDVFVFTTAKHNRLQYWVGGELVTISHMDRPHYLLGYLPQASRLILTDKELNTCSWTLLLPVLEYETAVMRHDFQTADRLLASVPKAERTRVAHFLEKQGFKQQALAVSMDPDHRFDLALQLGDLKTAYQLSLESDSDEKWSALARAATARGQLVMAGDCLGRAHDHPGLLLLASSAGSAPLLHRLAHESSEYKNLNVAFVSHMLLGQMDKCLQLLVESNRLPEAALFARTYLPSEIAHVVQLWQDKLRQQGQDKAADRLAEPTQYPNLFPDIADHLNIEDARKQAAPQLHEAPILSHRIDVVAANTNFKEPVSSHMANFIIAGIQQQPPDVAHLQPDLLARPEISPDVTYRQHFEYDRDSKTPEIVLHSQNKMSDDDLAFDDAEGEEVERQEINSSAVASSVESYKKKSDGDIDLELDNLEIDDVDPNDLNFDEEEWNLND